MVIDQLKTQSKSKLGLRAGPIEAEFYPDELFLRNLRVGGREALRGVYLALRDKNWSTPAPKVLLVEETIEKGSFQLKLEAVWSSEGIEFTAICALRGESDGSIQFEFDGEARSSFLRNRIGFVALHGAQDAGNPVCVKHVDGTLEKGVFPENISPHQPFFNIRSIEHPISEAQSLEIEFSGEVFEMEDQRNWSDASYKTYCTPLEKPFPVQLEKGDRIEQSIAINLRSEGGEEILEKENRELSIDIYDTGDAFVPLPKLGLEKRWGDVEPHTEAELRALSSLKLNHVRVELRFGHEGWEDDLTAGISLAESIGAELELALFVCEEWEGKLGKVFGELSTCKASVCHWLILDETAATPSSNSVSAVSQAIRDSSLGGMAITGTNANFTELNRNAPEPGPYEGLCFSINPQVHAFDDLSLIETLEMQGVISGNAQRVGRGSKAILSPVTLTQRFNAVAASKGDAFSYSEEADPRQKTMFGAVWTAGSILHAALGEAHSATYYKTRGPTAVMESTESGETILFPMYSIFEYLSNLKDAQVKRLKSSDPLSVEAWAIKRGFDTSYLLINYSQRGQSIVIHQDEDLEILGSVLTIGEKVSVFLKDPNGSDSAVNRLSAESVLEIGN